MASRVDKANEIYRARTAMRLMPAAEIMRDLAIPAALPDSPKVSTPRSIPSGPMVYPAVETISYPPGVDPQLPSGLPHETTPRKYKDTRAQLNLKISLEKLFQLRQWCEHTGTSQREAVEEAISLLCRQNTTPRGVDTTVDTVGSPADLIDREILSIIEFYKEKTGNEWTPADQSALLNLSGRVPVALISAGIIKSLIGSRARVETFSYCAKTALQIAAMPELGDGIEYTRDLWRRFDRNKSNIWLKQRP